VAGDDIDGSVSTIFRLASNRLLVTIVMQEAVGLEKSRAVTGRERRRQARRERRK
jgi:hypothetical protein